MFLLIFLRICLRLAKSCRSLLLANINPSLQMQVLNQVSCYSHLACDTMNYWIYLCPKEVEQVLKQSKYCVYE